MKRYLVMPCLFAALTSLLALVGCRPDFAPGNEVHGLRVLAVRGEPPTVLLGDQIEIEALAVTPDDGPVALKWELCEYTLGSDELRRCPAGTVLASGAGDALAFTFTEAIAERVVRYCDPAGDLGDEIPDGAVLPYCGQQGFSATVRVVAAGDGDEIVAVKTVFLFLGLGPQKVPTAPNQNPVITGLEGAMGAIQLGETRTLTCVIDEESGEEYVDKDGDMVEEDISNNWFISGGVLKGDSGGGMHGSDGSNDTQVEFEADPGSDQVTLWCVVYDGRGGVDWRRGDIAVDR